MSPLNQIIFGDCRAILPTLPADSVDCVVTSPPYFHLRDYQVIGQIGLEATPEEYVAQIRDICREIKRILKPTGTFWLVLGDRYQTKSQGRGGKKSFQSQNNKGSFFASFVIKSEIPVKNLFGIPWRVAFALQADGWYLRGDIIWSKTRGMPESVTDRCTRSHEYIFLLTKSQKYFYDAEAIKEPSVDIRPRHRDGGKYHQAGTGLNSHRGLTGAYEKRNKRSVWTVPAANYDGNHYATFPWANQQHLFQAMTFAEFCAREYPGVKYG